MRTLGVALILCILFAACNEKKVYDTFRHTPLAGWEKNDSLAFDVPKLKASGHYQSALALRINNEYPFMGLTLIVEQTVHPTHIKHVDTLNCALIGANGVPKGQGIGYYQYAFDITSMDLHEGDSLHISVRHDMKREILPGISNVGVSLTKR